MRLHGHPHSWQEQTTLNGGESEFSKENTVSENLVTVCGIYHDEKSARQTLENLRKGGFTDERLRIIDPHDPYKGSKLEPRGEGVAKEIVKDILIGSGVGGGVGVAGSAALALAQTAVFMSNPVLGTLMIAGYAATVGGIAGALKGVKLKETDMIGVASDALKEGYWIVAVHAADQDQEDKANRIFSESVADKTVSG
jgi:hypothetical protein